MNIAVTGATGFLGLNAANYFTRKGYNVIGFGRNQAKGLKIAGKFIQSDINDFNKMDRYLSETDVIIHSAALTSPWGIKDDFLKTNVQGTETILKLAKKHKVKKLIHISSPSIYFKFSDEFNIPENKELTEPFASVYTHTKYLAEKLIDASDVPTITLRPRGIFGPGDGALLPRLIRVATLRGLPTFGDGQNIIDITYVDNVTHAIEQSILAGEKYNKEKYNITNGEPIKIWDTINNLLKQLDVPRSNRKISLRKGRLIASLAEASCKFLPFLGEPPLTKYTLGLLTNSQTLDISKAKLDLNYSPKINMETAIKMVINDWKEAHES